MAGWLGYDSSDWNEPQLALSHYVKIAWRRKIAVLVTMVVIIAAGGAYTYLQPSLYQATAKVLLQPSGAEAALPDPDASRRDSGDRSQVKTEIEIMGSQSVQRAVEKTLGHRPVVSIEPRSDTDVVAITATSREPADAARTAQTYAQTYVAIRREQVTAGLLQVIDQIQAQIDPIRQQLAELDQPIAELNARIVATAEEDYRNRLQDQRDALIRETEGQRSLLQSREASYAAQLDRLRVASSLSTTGGPRVVDRAVAPTSPSSPQRMRNFVVTLGLSVLISMVVASLREHYDDTIKGKKDLELVTPNLPVLGLIPTVADWRHRKAVMLASETEPSSPLAEAYSALRTALQFAGSKRSLGLVQVTSPNQGETRTTTVCNLGVSLARAGHRVILVDCDLRKPRLHELFGLDNAVGFSSVLVEGACVADAVRPIPGEPGLAVLPSGPLPSDPSELLSSKRCSEALAVLLAEAEFVLLNGPPVLPVTDAIVLAGLVDGVIMVVDANATTRDSTNRAIELLEQADAPLIGNVLSRSR
ncbi:MAG: polysaccharide biosynthesis tyrosine autokinase [Egibacteraceae bacterium]